MVDQPTDDDYLRQIAQIMRNPAIPHFDPKTGDSLLVSPLSYCRICTTPIPSEYSYCYQCNSAKEQYGSEFPNLVIPLTYAGSTGQSLRDVYKYKEIPPSDGGVRRLSILLYFFVSRHGRCLENVSAIPLTSVVAVPSSKGRDDHPLRKFRRYFPDRMLEVDATFVGQRRGTRGSSISPDDFKLTKRVDDEHVLILEDTWVKGSNAVSLAIEAKRMGAAHVTVLPLARLLNTNYSVTGDWLDTETANLPFDPDFCPVTRGECP